MMRFVRKLFVLTLACAMVLGAACAQAEATYKDEIHIAANTVPETFDLAYTTSTMGMTMTLGSVYEALVTIDSNYNIKPELAESFIISDNFKTYTYVLRQGVKFHNGEPLTPEDVVASMNRWIEFTGAVKAAVGDSRFTKVDDKTVQIVFEKPVLYLNEMITKMAQRPIIVPLSVIEAADPATGMIKEYIGTGPYKFAEWVTDQYVKLVRNDDYVPYAPEGETDGWYGYRYAATPTVIYDIVKDDSTRTAGMLSGEYDVAMNMPLDDYDVFPEDEFISHTEIGGEMCMIYNKRQGIASNPVFRQAINAALDMEAIMTAANGDAKFFDLTSSYQSLHNSPWYSEAGMEYYNQANPEKAKELLAEAGYNGEEFKILFGNAYQQFYKAGVEVQAELNAIGVNCTLDIVDWSTYLANSQDPTKFDAFITSFSIKAVPTLFTYLSPTWGGWCDDPAMVDGLAYINSAESVSAAIAKWQELQEYCWKEYVPISKFGTTLGYTISSNKIEDYDFFEGMHAWNIKVIDE